MTGQRHESKQGRTRWWHDIQDPPRRATLRLWTVRFAAIGLGIGILLGTSANWRSKPTNLPEQADRPPHTPAAAADPTNDGLTMHETVRALGDAHSKLEPMNRPYENVPQAYGTVSMGAPDERHSTVPGDRCVQVEGSCACTLPPPVIAPGDFRAAHAYGIRSIHHGSVG